MHKFALVLILAMVSGTVLAAADLQIKALTDTPDPALRGGRITYDVSIENNNIDDATNAKLTFPLPASTSFESVNYSGPGGGCSHDGGNPGTVTCDFGTIGPNSTDIRNVTLAIRTTAATGNTLDVTATVATSAVDSNSSNDTENQQTTINNGADLALSISDNPDPAVAAGIVTYTLGVQNQGPNAAVNVSVSDPLPPGVTYQSASGSGWSCSAAGQTVTCSRSNLAPGAAAPDIQITAAITGITSGNVTNSATVIANDAGGNNMDPELANNTATEDTQVTAGTDLTISKTVTQPVIAGTIATFTLRPRNLGPNPAANVIVEDPLPAGFVFNNASGPNWSCAETAATVTCTRANLPVGASDDITIEAAVPLSGGGTVNTATITSDTDDPVNGNNSGTASYSIVPTGADLSLSKSKSPQPVAVGSNMTSTIRVRNHGPNATSGTVTVTDVLAAGETFVSASGTNWTCSGVAVGASGSLICEYAGTLNPNSNSTSLTVETQANAAGNLANSASVADVNGEDDGVAGNNSASASVTATTEKADLVVTKSVSDALLDNSTPENSFTYTIQITNNGPNPASGIRFTDAIPGYYSGPAGTTGIAVITTPAGFNCSVSGRNVSCNQTSGGSLASGANATFDIKVSRPLQDGTLTNSVTAFSSDVGDPDRSNNGGSVTHDIEPIADVEMQSVTVTPDPVPEGVEATYVLSFRNKGPSTAQGVEVALDFTGAADFTFISATATEGSCSYGAPILTCSGITLNNNEARSVTVKIRPDFTAATPTRTTLASTATITTTSVQSDTSNDQANVTLNISPSDLDLLVNKVDLTDPLGFDPGDRTHNIWTYDIRLTNQGPSLATGIVITDVFTPKDGREIKFLCDKTSSSVSCDGDSAGAGNNAGYCNQQGTGVTGPSSLTITCTFPASTTLAAGANLHHYLEFEVVSPPDPSGDTHNNQATVRANENENNTGNNTEAEATTILKRVDLGLAKIASASPVSLREPFQWTVTVTNQGPGISDTTTLADTLPSGMELTATPTWSTDNSAPTTGSCVSSGNAFTCDVGLLEVGKQATVTIPARMTAFPSGGTIANCATGSTDQVDPNSSNNVTVCGNLQVVRSSISGRVYQDLNDNGAREGSEAGIAGVSLRLTGTDAYGNGVDRTAQTSGSGVFRFDNLSPSDSNGYTLSETQPAGFNDGMDSAGGLPGVVGNDQISGIVLGPDQQLGDYLFGELPPATIAGTVWFDQDNDGVLDGGENTRIAGVNLTLSGTDNLNKPVMLTTVTAADGSYQFTGLRPGSYTVQESQPGGWLDGKDNPGNSGATLGNDLVSNILLMAGQSVTGVDFGELAAASLAGRVFIDPNANANLDNDESLMIPGVTVTLTGTDDLTGSVSRIETTDATGQYRFTGLRPGSYKVTETQPSQLSATGVQVGSGGGIGGSDATTQFVDGVTIHAGDALTDYNFGHLGAKIEATVYQDQDGDGQFDGATDVPLPGIEVIITDVNGVDHRLMTDSNGYASQLVAPGPTRVDVDDGTLPAGLVLTNNAHGQGNDPTVIDVPLGGIVRDNNGYLDSTAAGAGASARLEGVVYEDIDGDGLYSADTDRPLPGVSVKVRAANGAEFVLSTDASGRFGQVVAPGQARIDIDDDTLPAGLMLTSDVHGQGNDASLIVVPAGGVARDDTGYIATSGGRLEGRVYQDNDGNGRFDAGSDVPYPAVDVLVTASNGARYRLVTDLNGEFSRDVPEGETRVDVDDSDPDLPGGVILTVNNQGDGEDPSLVTVPAGGSARDDTGYQLPVPGSTGLLEGRIYHDENNNGLFDEDEPVFPGVRVLITAANGAVYELLTDSAGEFARIVPAGATQVDVDETDLPQGYLLTQDDHGNGNDPTSVNVPAGGSVRDDNGYRQPPKPRSIPTLNGWGLILLILLLTVMANSNHSRAARKPR